MKNETKNELIAKYMGWKQSDGNDGVYHHGQWYNEDFTFLPVGTKPEFDKSWDMLMPVVHKIVKTEMPEKRGWSYEYLQLESTRIGNSIDYVYMKVVEYLKHKSRGGSN